MNLTNTPPLAEKGRIGAILDQLMAMVDKLDAQLTATDST
jgi:hypothetical protein